MEFNRPTGPSRRTPGPGVRLGRVGRVLVWIATFVVTLVALALAIGAVAFAFGLGIGFSELLVVAAPSAGAATVIVRRIG